jgi:hypothetical protein
MGLTTMANMAKSNSATVALQHEQETKRWIGARETMAALGCVAESAEGGEHNGGSLEMCHRKDRYRQQAWREALDMRSGYHGHGCQLSHFFPSYGLIEAKAVVRWPYFAAQGQQVSQAVVHQLTVWSRWHAYLPSKQTVARSSKQTVMLRISCDRQDVLSMTLAGLACMKWYSQCQLERGSTHGYLSEVAYILCRLDSIIRQTTSLPCSKVQYGLLQQCFACACYGSAACIVLSIVHVDCQSNKALHDSGRVEFV